MHLVRMIYVSHMTEACDMQGLREILTVSRKKNLAQEITGMLCYDPVFFLQCLEGPRDAVNELYATILRDGRHMDVVLLDYGDIEKRDFADWSMAFIAADQVDRKILAKYTGKEKFDPYKLKAEQAQSFLLEVLAHHHAQMDG